MGSNNMKVMSNTQKTSARIIQMCAVIYMISYITRNSYNVIISEMVTSTGLAKSELSIALTGAFIVYGIGQLLSGYFGDRIQPKVLIGFGLFTTSCMNLAIPFCQNITQMTLVWCLNGFAQAFMWPPIVKILYTTLSLEDYSIGCVRVSSGSSIGNILVYLSAPLLIVLAGWKSVFTVAAIMGLIGLLYLLKVCPAIDLQPRKKTTQASHTPMNTASIIALVLVIIAIILHGILRDGVGTWMPSYISETFGLRNEISILSGVLLPIFAIISYSTANYLYSRIKNPVICACLIFGMSTVFCSALYCLADSNAVVSILLSAFITGCMHGVNLMLIGIAPTAFAKNGKISFFSGLLNCSVYAGSAIATYLIPMITEQSGWAFNILLWAFYSAAGCLICLICIQLWKRLQSE